MSRTLTVASSRVSVVSTCASFGLSSFVDLLELDNAPKVLPSQVERFMEDASKGIQRWNPQEHELHEVLQEAATNYGAVHVMQRRSDAGKFAVKKMPTKWIQNSYEAFKQKWPTAKEQPWYDIGFLKALEEMKFPYICKLQGIFQDERHTFVVSTLATDGDLLTFCADCPRPGAVRERLLLPLMVQVCAAVRAVHDLGVAHRDLSPENIVVAEEEGKKRIKLIDFGMASTCRLCAVRRNGKTGYLAPELYTENWLDAFLSDTWAVGIICFVMVTGEYPWKSAQPGACPYFTHAQQHGFKSLAEDQHTLRGHRDAIRSVLSAEMIEFLDKVLKVDPAERCCLGEAIYLNAPEQDEEPRESAWNLRFLKLPIKGGVTVHI